ncbi:MAG: DnaA regulatory inactivator Hda [Moraxellaceae bacterium]|nr:DnaA regulatory inactivator Hda [Moraxellaceae bacterium]MDZ4385960.1 DnaA regulatory inactivator Hda [Moraxellaceae bacterium]
MTHPELSLSEQLLLPLTARPQLRLANLPTATFTEVRAALALCRLGEMEQLYIWGEAGSGRSLLLQSFCAEVADAILLPMRQVVFMPAEMLEGLESNAFVVLDDIDAIVGWPAWEEALFNLYNRLRASGGRLLVSASVAPHELNIGLPDLASRLASMAVYRLPAPDDALREQFLQQAAQQRAWTLEPEVSRYLLERGPRRLGSFLQLIERVDAAALREQRALTVPLVRSVLELA